MTTRLAASLARLSLPGFFAAKLASGLALLKLSTLYLSGIEFAAFTQLMLLSALLNLVAAGGLQMGLILEVARVRDQPREEARLIANALAIWAGLAVLVAVPMLALAPRVSEVLVGIDDLAGPVAMIALLAMAGGPGQIFTSLLTGRKRPPASLAAQAIGLLAATAGAVTGLVLRQPALAAGAFAAGPVVTTLLSGWLARVDRLPIGAGDVARAVVTRLLRYSVAFVVTASLFPLMLFAQRHLYVGSFGIPALNDWLIASRVSDTSTQLLSLYLAQYFLPGFAAAAAGQARAVLAGRALLVGWAMLGGVALVFAIGADFLIPLFLSAAFLAAKGPILAYLVADVLRVGVSVALHAALADRRLLHYVGIEATVVAVFGIICGTLIAAGWASAPYVAQIGTYAAVSLALAVVLAARWLRRTRPIPTG